MLIVSVILFIIICLLLVEKQDIRSCVRSFRIRILVNGTRGKSSVTEYIASGILNSQPDVMAKITGKIPKIIHNGLERTVRRAGVARVQEQISILRLAAKENVKYLILECMSLSPAYQQLESLVFQPHIYVITNIRDDHREEMGKSIGEQAESICSAIPKNCTVITNETRYLYLIKETAAIRNSIVVSLQDQKNIHINELPEGIFFENVALALAVCDIAGVDRKLAEEGVMRCVLTMENPLSTIIYGSKKIRFLNAFAVNDIDSTVAFINNWLKIPGYNGRFSVIFNSRGDRPLRTDLFAGWLGKVSASIDAIIITGDHLYRARYSLLRAGVENEKIYTWREKQLISLKKNLFETVSEGSLVAGVGNIGGTGFRIINELK
jgi:poly-gamma-glutamate synthase PgsB/CapB